MEMLVPPYRLNTAEEVERFIGKSRRKTDRAMLKFARQNGLVRPPIMSRMPDEVTLNVFDMKKEVRKVVENTGLVYEVESARELVREARENILEVAEGAPEGYYEMVAGQLVRCRDLLGKAADREERDLPKHDIPRKGLELLAGKSELYDLLAELLKRYLSTKNRSLQAFLKQSILLLVAYEKENFRLDEDMLGKIRSLGEDSAVLLSELHKALGDRLNTEKQLIFNSCLYLYLALSKGKIMKMKASAFFKQNVMVLMDEFVEHKDRKRARTKWKKLVDVYGERTGKDNLRRMKSVVDNFLAKVWEFEDFFNVTLQAGELRKVYQIYGRNLEKTVITEEAIATGVRLALYPCKDYHDFLKGRYSGDCTTNTNTAAQQLLHERFFNVRIFRDDAWIGNIYCLDYTDKKNALVLDRIQLKKSVSLMPVSFFPRFMDVVLNDLLPGADVAIFGPPRISNFQSIENSYSSFCRGRSLVEFKFEKEDGIFECSQRSYMYLLT